MQSALVWLKSKNPAYADIMISQERLNQLPLDGEIVIHTVEYDPNTTTHINDKGPTPVQIDPCISDIDSDTVSGVLLPEPAVDIRKHVENTVKEVIGEDHGEVRVNKQGIVTIPWPTRDTRHDTQHQCLNLHQNISFP